MMPMPGPAGRLQLAGRSGCVLQFPAEFRIAPCATSAGQHGVWLRLRLDGV